MKRIRILPTSLAHDDARSMTKPGRPSRIVTLPIVLMCMTACTFPDVDYSDQTANPFSQACTLPAPCEDPTDLCAKKADIARDACLKKCGPSINADCTSCETALATDLNKCLAQCDTCSTDNGCDTALDSCKARLGIK